jgi:pyruvate formate lyase activating enzyme
MPLPIKGLQKTSLLDYPDRLSCVVFIGGCNFRCPFCHNSELVLHPESMPDISEDEVLKFLKSRKGWMDSVVLTGGEPTLYSELPYFMEKVKQLGFAVKLDTNGTNSTMLRQLIKANLVDYIAMDIKAPMPKYKEAAGVPNEPQPASPVRTESSDSVAAAAGQLGFLVEVKESVADIMNSRVKYEFRTTVIPRLHSEADVLAIAEWLKGADRFVIQQFRPVTPINPDFKFEKRFTQEQLERMADKARQFVKHVEVR